MKMFSKALLIGAATLAAMPAHALTFAEFSGAGSNWLAYTGVASGNGGALSGNTTVNFDGNGLGFFEMATGTKFTLSATSTTAPSSWANGQNSTQVFQTGTLTFTASNAFAAAHSGKTNLLTATFTNGALNVTPLGSKNVGFAVTDGEQQFDNSISTITYTSDYFDFTDAKDYDFAFSVTGTTTTVMTPSGQDNVGPGTYKNFKASGPGSFAAAVPEPDQWAMLLVGFGLVGSTMRRRRNMSMVTA